MSLGLNAAGDAELAALLAGAVAARAGATIVHVHVRETEGAGWQYALLYRDWLRSDADARADYLTEKRRLAGTCATTREYAEAKEPWFNHIWPRMQSWARRTGWHS